MPQIQKSAYSTIPVELRENFAFSRNENLNQIMHLRRLIKVLDVGSVDSTKIKLYMYVRTG